MATRTTTKTKPHKPAAAKKTVKAAVSHKSAPKGKPVKLTKPSSPTKASVASHPAPPSKPVPHSGPQKTVSAPPSRRPAVESVSLIDKGKIHPKADRPEKIKRAVLPPISRNHESLKTSLAPVEKVEAPAEQPPDRAAGDGTEVAAPEAEATAQRVIHIKPPIIVKHLATELGLKPHQLIAELMNHNIFANINQTIEPDIASKIAESHGFVLEKERRE